MQKKTKNAVVDKAKNPLTAFGFLNKNSVVRASLSSYSVAFLTTLSPHSLCSYQSGDATGVHAAQDAVRTSGPTTMSTPDARTDHARIPAEGAGSIPADSNDSPTVNQAPSPRRSTRNRSTPRVNATNSNPHRRFAQGDTVYYYPPMGRLSNAICREHSVPVIPARDAGCVFYQGRPVDPPTSQASY